MTKTIHFNNKFCEKKAIDEIGKKYLHLDDEYSQIINFPANKSISPDGLSLLDDLEFFLSQPSFNAELEEELFQVIQVFALKYLRSRRAHGEKKNAKTS